MIQREHLAEFLRTRRDRLQPAQAGLPGGDRRRTPGLRRQEVAQLAGISIDYYIRLEQGRGPTPSRQILTALARALILGRDDRDYLFHVAGQSPPPATAAPREVTAAVRWMLDGMPEIPAYVVDAQYDLLAWNTPAGRLLDDLITHPGPDRNLLRWMLGHADTDTRWDHDTAFGLLGVVVADLRAEHARRPGETGRQRLITDLRAASPSFTALWQAHDVTVHRRIVKRFNSHTYGQLEFDCQLLHLAETDQRLITYCAEPDSPTRAVFRRLAAQTTATSGR